MKSRVNPFNGALVFDGGTVQIPEVTPVNAVAATGTITITGTPVANETFVVGAQTFTFKASRNVAGEVTISAVNTDQAHNITVAIAADITNVTSDHALGVVTLTAAVKGAAGNAIVLTKAATGVAVNGAGTLGGTVAGVDGTVGFENELRADASYLYHATAVNTVADTNWRRVSLGTAY